MKECTRSVKLLVSDIDGTYTTDWKENNIAVEKFCGNGNILAFITGRTLWSYHAALTQLLIKPQYAAVNNGATVLFGDEIISNTVIPENVVNGVLDFLLKYAEIIELNTVYGMSVDLNSSKSEITELAVYLPMDIAREEFCTEVNNRFPVECVKVRNSNRFEICSLGVNKANAARIIARHAKIDEGNIYAVGDGYSDYGMIASFNGFAMDKCDDILNKFEKVRNVKSLIEKIEG